LARTIRAEGFKTLICSNNFPARIKGLQEKFGFLDDFDVVVLACEVGDIKPNKKIFEELIKRSGVQPDEIFYTDDSQAALDTAKGLGISTHYYAGFEEFVETLEKLGIKIGQID
jgi:HAD superfamily hydrolase (TIGR01509 family)